MKTTRYDSYCGLYCGACPIMAATLRGNVEEKAAQWEMAVKDVICRGCKSNVRSTYCADCVMRLCARDHDLDFCVECDDYPCTTVQAFERDGYPHHTGATANLKAIDAQGVETWLAEQKARWSCSACGTAFTWYEDKCSSCGAALYDARAEERDLAAEKGKGKDEDSGYWKIRRDISRFR